MRGRRDQRQMALRRCLECGFLYPGTPDDDQKCSECAGRASAQMLGEVLLAVLVIIGVVGAGIAAWSWRICL